MTAHPIDTEALRKLADAATEGPWVQNGRNGIHTPIGSCVALTHRHDDDERKADAEFIAAAREAVPALLDALAAAEHRATRAEAQSEARRIDIEYWQGVARGNAIAALDS